MDRPDPDMTLRPLSDVPDYLKARYGTTVTRATVYNWVTNGRRGVKLQVKQDKVTGKYQTTYQWVRNFLART
jgi:hypothetical protein